MNHTIGHSTVKSTRKGQTGNQINTLNLQRKHNDRNGSETTNQAPASHHQPTSIKFPFQDLLVLRTPTTWFNLIDTTTRQPINVSYCVGTRKLSCSLMTVGRKLLLCFVVQTNKEHRGQ